MRLPISLTVLAACLAAAPGFAAADATPAGAPAPAPAAAPAPAPAAATAAPAAHRVMGRGETVDETAKKITVSGFNGDDTTMTWNDSTVFLHDVDAQPSEIKVGDTLRVITDDPGDGKTVAPRFANIVPASYLKDPPFDGGPFTAIMGVVATTTPTLTITTDDKKTLTVNLTDSHLTRSVDGKAGDIKDQFIIALVGGPDTALVASKIHYLSPPN